MKIKFSENINDELMTWAIIHVCTEALGDLPSDFDSDDIDISLTVNGKETPLLPIIKYIYDDMQKRADEISSMAIENIGYDIKREIDEAIERLREKHEFLRNKDKKW